MKDILNFLQVNKIKFSRNESLKNHTNIKIGGDADLMVFPISVGETVRCLKYFHKNGIKYYVVGNGTNLLCSDTGYRGVIIKLGGNLCGYKVSGNTIYAESGLSMFRFNKICRENGLSGLEFSYGIPGSVGGAVSMNAGSYGGTVSDRLKSVKVFDTDRIRTIKKKDMDFSYRHSKVFEKGYVVLGATFEFERADNSKIEEAQNQYLDRRKNSQPYADASAGSVFKRIDGTIPVSKMIDDLGLKGKNINGAQISEIHAGFIVNKRQATCQDVLKLVKYIQEEIKKNYNVDIELEIKVLGETDEIIR